MVDKVKKIIKILIILLLICITILILYALTGKAKAIRKLEKINNYEIKDYKNAEIELPDNIEELIANYNGEIENRTIYKNLYYFANELVPKYYLKLKNIRENDLNQYFDDNADVIYIELGIDSQEKFYSFANHVKKLNGNELVFSNFSILETSIRSQGSKGLRAYLSIKYNDNENILFNLKIENELNAERTSILYFTDIDDEVIKREEEAIKTQEEKYEATELDFPRGKAID